jgi:hypothetical protein
MPLFEVAILRTPTKNEAEAGTGEELVFGPKAVIAHDAQSAAVGAVLGEPALAKVDRQRMQILIRPFA